MPCYQLVLLAKPDTTPEVLASLFKNVARVVFREHGQMRTLQNYGVRPLAYPIRKGGSKFEEARWVHAYYDVAPGALANVGSAIQTEKAVLQYKHLVADGPLARFSPSGRTEKLKRFSAAMRFNADIFDPATLRVAPASEGKALA